MLEPSGTKPKTPKSFTFFFWSGFETDGEKLKRRAQAQANTKAFVRYLYNLTSIIMDKVRCFIQVATTQAKMALSR